MSLGHLFTDERRLSGHENNMNGPNKQLTRSIVRCKMTRPKRLTIVPYLAAVFLAALSLDGCRSSDRVISGNQGLRLTPQEVRMNKERASRGDAEAAHNLWLYYDFVEGNPEKADYWKAQYDRLRSVRGHE
jgi:hypothetical protein